MTHSHQTFPALIGIGGHYRSGKDTFAELLQEHLRPLTITGFSAPLREAVSRLNPYVEPGVRYLDLEAERGFIGAKAHPEVRRLYQALGTDVGRNIIGEDCWVDIAQSRIAALRGTGVNVAITGVRFPNELGMVKRLGGVTVWIERKVERNLSGHASELSLTSGAFDVVIGNDGTLEDLAQAASDFVRDHVH